jgi:stage II sporulation protein M
LYGKIRKKNIRDQNRALPLRLIFLAAFFLSGVVLGQVLSSCVPDAVSYELTQYLEDFLLVSEQADITAQMALSTLLIYFRYPLLVFLFGLTALGILLIPTVSVIYGFFLSFSVSCFTAVFGGDGVLLAFSVLGLRCLITLPCYFLIAVPAFQKASLRAASLFRRGNRTQSIQKSPNQWLRLWVVVLILLSGSVAELFCTPQLLRVVLERILN